jgi:mono/diheme cytochrome c family protein
MTILPRKNRPVTRLLFVVVLSVIAICIVYAANHFSDSSWPVPEEAKQLKNPVPPSEAALQSAKTVYQNKCANCHGNTGAGDGRDAERYDPPPADFTDTKLMHGRTDGELFYKISEGKKPMPVFKAKLTEEQRWQLVLLLRSFASFTKEPH